MAWPHSACSRMLLAQLFTLGMLGVAEENASEMNSLSTPNVMVFLVDDMGYGDLSAGETPNLDKMANEGVRFTSWLSASSICTPSRAALLTGRYAQRMGLTSDDWRFRVLNSPGLPGGLPFEEVTLAEHLRKRGYVTQATGKWHLGIGPGGIYLPTSHGFDSFYGMGCTNVLSCDPERQLYTTSTLLEFVIRKTPEMWTAIFSIITLGYMAGFIRGKRTYAVGLMTLLLLGWVWWYTGMLTLVNPLACVLYRGRDVVQQPVSLHNLTQRLVGDAQHFIRKSSVSQPHRPFFLYMSFVKMHTALFANPEFQGISKLGPYGDNLAELDWAVGAIMSTVAEENLEANTLTFMTSDNGG